MTKKNSSSSERNRGRRWMPMYTTCEKKDDIKIRNNSYYNMESTFDDLYKKSQQGYNFYKLMEIIVSENNLKLAYRNIKKNTGSYTAGCDGITIKDIKDMNEEEVIRKIQTKLHNFNPKLVKRVEIPKANGKMRPLGIPSIWDRIIQQAILQVMEPIAEAKFHPNSNGFRPLKSCETAMAQTMKLIQLQKLYYVVDFDIKGFFDNVNHNKLMSQLWNMGFRDKRLLTIIKKMLKANIKMPDGTVVTPEKGTPQGGVLSPLLANIVLNDLDWWIDSQWAGFPTKKEYACYEHENGSINRAHKFSSMRDYSKLKEVFFVRYADDFKLFCKNLESAKRLHIATSKWLKEELKLEISEEKTKVVNLKTDKSDFLGFTIGTTMKGNKRICVTHISPKNIERIQKALVEKVKEMQKPHDENELFLTINRYNSIVIGIHNYYKIATCVYLDLEPVQQHMHYVFANRIGKEYNRNGCVPKGYISDNYGKSAQIRYIHKKCVIPIGSVKNVDAKFMPRKYNKYTVEGREAIKTGQGINMEILHLLLARTFVNRSMEYMDNRITVYTAQRGKCRVMGTELTLDNMHCHHMKPISLGGTDEFKNLIYIRADIHKLIHAVKSETIDEMLKQLNLNNEQLNKVNKLRSKCDLEAITQVNSN